jgi:hypothetical protein
MTSATEMELVGNTDAQRWAQEFVRMVTANPAIPTDEGTMIGWFANAIMAGYDEGTRKERQRDVVEKLRELIFQAAGAATGPLLEDHPDLRVPVRARRSGCRTRLR